MTANHRRPISPASVPEAATDTREITDGGRADLRDQPEVSHWFKANRPEYVFLVAGTVGGIMANSTRPVEFIYGYSDDMHINVGSGVDLSIRELAEKVRDVVNPQAELVFDRSKPDGTPRKVRDVSRLRNLGLSPTYDLDAGIRSTYDWFVAEQAADGELRGMASEAETV